MATEGAPAGGAEGAATDAGGETGGDFDAALTAAIAETPGEAVEEADVNAPAPDEGGEKNEAADEGDGEDGEEKPADEPKKDKPKDDKPDSVREKFRAELTAEIRKELRGEFSALARDRSKLREREAAAAATEQRAKAFEQKAGAYDNLVERLRADPAKLVHEAGGEELVNKLLDGIVAMEKSPAEREVQRMRAELEARDKATKEAEQRAQVEAWKSGVRTAVASNESFDLVNALGQHDAVIQTIEDYYVKYGGAILPVEDAAQAVEDILARGLAKSKKFGARAPGTNAQPSKTGTPAPSGGRKPTGTVTLGSVHSSEVPASAGDELPLDPDKRFKAVMAAL